MASSGPFVVGKLFASERATIASQVRGAGASITPRIGAVTRVALERSGNVASMSLDPIPAGRASLDHAIFPPDGRVEDALEQLALALAGVGKALRDVENWTVVLGQDQSALVFLDACH